MPRLAIITTHPIQYNAPWFALLAKQPGIELKVFYTWSQRQKDLYDKDFGKSIEWDIPLLEGYDYQFIENTSPKPGNKSFNGIICPELIPAIKEWKASHLLVFGWNFKAHFSAMRYFHGKIPVIFRGDSTLLDEKQGYKTCLRRMVLKFIYSYVDKALYTGASNKEYFLKHGIREENLFFAPHAIDNNRFSVLNDELEQELRKRKTELNITSDNHIFIFVGKFEAKKSPLLLLKAFQELKKMNSNAAYFKLVFVGNGILENELKKSASHPDIHFLPFQNQSIMPVIYRLGNTLCLPSGGPGETWGLVVNEALASGLNCIISSNAGCAEDLGRLTGNYIFSSGNMNALMECMLLSSKQVSPDQQTFTRKYSFESIVHTLNTILQIE
jgi:glycosyltransferase involved in cell wall biosynthesis